MPAPPELAQAREDHRHGGRHQRQGHPAAGRGGGEVGLEAPEGPEEGQPVAQAHPGQPAAVGPKAAERHQGRDQQQQAVRPGGQERASAQAAEDQGHKEEQPTEEGTGRQEEHTDLETAPAQGGRCGRSLGQQPTIKGLQKGAQGGETKYRDCGIQGRSDAGADGSGSSRARRQGQPCCRIAPDRSRPAASQAPAATLQANTAVRPR